MTRWLLALRRGWRTVGRSGRLDRELDRELRSHLDDQAEAYMARGLPEGEARRRARLDLGSLVTIAEESREARGGHLIETIVRDLRYGWRALVRQPVLLVAATLSIALGVGANLTLYSLANALVFVMPSAADPDSLVHLRTGAGSHVPFEVWRRLDQGRPLAGVAGYRLEYAVNLRQGNETLSVAPMLVTANYFDVVGLPLAEGRGFGPAHAAARDPRVTVIGDALGRRLFGDPHAALGRQLTINDDSYTVIGLLPPDSRSLAPFGLSPELYLPISPALLPAIASVDMPAVQLAGRLAPGQSFDQARDATAAMLSAIGADLADDEVAHQTAFERVGGLGSAGEFEVVVLFGVVLAVVAGLVLLIACANVAGLLIARAASRRREVAMRLALGATRRRLVRQLLTESLLLAVSGSGLGLAVAWVAGLGLSRVSLPLDVPLSLAPAFDGRLLAAALSLIAVTTLFCGLLPALHATRLALAPAMQPGPPPTGAGGRLRLRRGLVAGQVAISALLVVVAVVFARNLTLTAAVDPGFDADRTAVVQVQFVEGRQGAAGAPTIERVADAVAALPGVRSAAATHHVPLTLLFGASVGTELRFGPSGEPARAEFVRLAVGPGYFDTMGIGVRGRGFTSSDRVGAEGVAVINEAFAERYFPSLDPLGQRIDDPRELGRSWRVVGVAADSKSRTLGEGREPALYLSMLQADAAERIAHVVVRVDGAPAAASAALRAAVLREDPSAAVTAQPMVDALSFAFLPSRIGALVLGGLGALGTVLAMVGLFGVVSYAVARRAREIGIRMALGATRSAVMRLVLRDASAVVLLGLAAGLGLSVLATRPLAAFLVAGLAPNDPASYALTAGLLAVASVLAAWAPVARATRIDPVEALRHD